MPARLLYGALRIQAVLLLVLVWFPSHSHSRTLRRSRFNFNVRTNQFAAFEYSLQAKVTIIWAQFFIQVETCSVVFYPDLDLLRVQISGDCNFCRACVS